MDRLEQIGELIGEWVQQQQRMGVLLLTCVDEAVGLYQERREDKWHIFWPDGQNGRGNQNRKKSRAY